MVQVFDGTLVHAGVVTYRGVRAAASFYAENTAGLKRTVADEKGFVFLGINIVGYRYESIYHAAIQ